MTMMFWRCTSILALVLASCHALLTQSTAVTQRSRHVLWGGSQIERVPSNDATPLADDEEPAEPAPEKIVLPSMSLEQLLSPRSDCDVTQMGPTGLAYVGDVVFELFVRSRMVWPTRRTSDLQEQVVSLVRAEHQANLLALLMKDFVLTQKEQQIIVRGRNSGSVKGNRRKTPAYNDATALEALIGYVYITDKDRCTEILNWLYANLNLGAGS